MANKTDKFIITPDERHAYRENNPDDRRVLQPFFNVFSFDTLTSEQPADVFVDKNSWLVALFISAFDGTVTVLDRLYFKISFTQQIPFFNDFGSASAFVGRDSVAGVSIGPLELEGGRKMKLLVKSGDGANIPLATFAFKYMIVP